MTIKNRWMSTKEFEAAIIRLNLSWTEAAELLDVTYRQILHMRKGTRAVPKQTSDVLRCWLQHGLPVEAK